MPSGTFGVALFCTESTSEGVKFAKLVEDLGYQKLWVGDSHMIWREVYILLGAIAVATKQLHIGPGVTHPVLRHPTVTASAMVSLNELTGGRAYLGIGIGATGPGNIGLKPVSLKHLEGTVQLIRRLFSGETVDLDGKAIRCVYASSGRIPIYIAATSPRTHDLAAVIADGIVCGCDVELLETIVQNVRRRLSESGRASDQVKIVCWSPCSIDNNRAEARNAVRGMVARAAMVYLGHQHKKGQLVDKEDQKAVERLWREYDMYHHMGPEHDHLVRDEWIDRYSIAGTPEEVREKVRKILRAGADEIGIVPFGKSKETLVKTFAREVMEKL